MNDFGVNTRRIDDFINWMQSNTPVEANCLEHFVDPNSI
jgi:hypothetical protein